jgi:hypothetical protein
MSNKLSGKAAFITGANKGIGFDTARKAVVSVVEETARETGGPVLLLGRGPHRPGSNLSQNLSGKSCIAGQIGFVQHAIMAGELTPLFLADPQAVGTAALIPGQTMPNIARG